MQKCNDNKYLNDEYTFKLYNIASEFLEENGYSRVSMRCFIKNDSDNENVIKFSECGFKSSLALGCGGRSYLGRLHTCSDYTTDNKQIKKEINSFINTKDFTKVANGIILNDDEIKRRYVIKHLMILPGINISRYRKLFNSDIESDFECIEKFIKKGLLEKNEEYIGLSKIGLAYSDYIGPQFISKDIKNKMTEWDNMYDL